MRTLIAAAFVCASAALVAPALAQDSTSDSMSPWFFRAGAAELVNMDGLKLTVAGQPVPGAALHYNHVYSGLVEVGYTFLPGLSGVLSVGWPPSIGVFGGGSLAPVGRMESTTIGPSALTVQYKPFQDGLFGGFFQPAFDNVIPILAARTQPVLQNLFGRGQNENGYGLGNLAF